ncbi:META domain-containing protein [uncultured Alistipes sp.]|uniref:META domain-containing protein n=1 Tax=uncultured Alistipes sp. TaxID=538949 RepID=UPI0026086AD0|nr:META domain-containing protein [uncultured Alistipes sp.]
MKKILLVAATLLVALTACDGGKKVAALEDTAWKLSKMEGIPTEAITAEADSFTLMFDAADTLLSGRTNCNRIFGKYVHEGDKFDMGNLGMTRMACPDMQYEIRFTKMLSEVDRYEISGSTLKLYEGDKLLAEFRPVVEAEKK